LTKIDYVSSNITIQSCFYSYDINKNLTAIRKRAGTLAELVAYFTYNERSQLIDFVDCKDYSALVFNYENISSEDIFKASSITSGVVNIETIKSGIIKIGDVMDVPFFGKLTFVNESETNKNTILYQALNHRTVVTNSEGVVVVYFYNERGFTTSILEAHNGDLNDLRTLEKTPGVSIQDYGNSGETINGRSRIIWQGDSPLYIHGATEFQRLYNYRRNKYPVLVNYTISFWLRQPRKFDNPQIQVQIQSNDVRTEVDTAYAKFDNSAYGWQFIQVPIRISHKNIDWIRLNLVGMERESVHITDMRIEKSPKQTFYIATDNSNQNNWMALDEVVSVSYTGPNPDTNTIGSDFYISEADLEMTYLSYFEARDNNAIGDNFILSACDNTKKIEVNSVNFSNGTRSLNVSFVADAYGGNTRAGYRNVMESPDGNLTTEGRAYFIRSQVIDNVTVDCICQRTTATRGNNISNTQVFYDLKGNKRLETDEANVQTIYHYDSNFILNKRIIQSATGERIISEATTSSNLRTEKHPTSEIKVEKSSPFGIVERTSYNGLGEKGIPLVTSIEYDEFEERIRSVCNNVDGKNSLKFNVRGQLESVSPLDVSNNVMYSHEFEYDIDNRPFRSFFVGSRGRVLISEKIVNKAERRITTREFRTSGNASDADTTIVSMDKYGSTSEINENGNVTTFQKQGSTINNSYTLDGASMGAAEVTSMFDPFENRTYVYSYDEANDPTGYQIRAGNNLAGAEHFSVRTIGSNEVEYRGVTHFESKTETRYHQNRLLEPLVEKTIITDTHANRLPNGHLLNTSERLTQETLYNYDNLDRIAEKRTRIPGGFDTWLNETNSYKPNSFLLEKTEIELRNPTV
ncbi:MAG: hypothetical protein FWE36_08965, partial [Erysipelotrichales bacterium]|nr:hypothetical protein [Erysipelotrichales bacterium]